MDLEKLKREPAGPDARFDGRHRPVQRAGPLVEREGGLSLLYEVRAGSLRRQPGRCASPGGRLEGAGIAGGNAAPAGDLGGAGDPREKIRILGRLDFVAHRANFIPPSGAGPGGGGEAVDGLHLNPDEVAEVFQVPLEHLRNEPPLSTTMT